MLSWADPSTFELEVDHANELDEYVYIKREEIRAVFTAAHQEEEDEQYIDQAPPPTHSTIFMIYSYLFRGVIF